MFISRAERIVCVEMSSRSRFLPFYPGSAKDGVLGKWGLCCGVFDVVFMGVFGSVWEGSGVRLRGGIWKW